MDDFKIDIANLIAKGRRNLNKHVEGVEITAPGITFVLSPHDPEVTSAKKAVIFLSDRRVLNSKECCDNCIDRSLESLSKIREYVVCQQQELAHLSDGGLYLMFEFVVDAIRQFLTYSEYLERDYEPRGGPISDFRRHPDARKAYFEALKQLREHIAATMHQIRIIAGTDPRKIPDNLRFRGWKANCYSDTSTKTQNAEQE